MSNARSDDHVQGLLDWVNVVADEDCGRLEELQDGRVLGQVLQNMYNPAHHVAEVIQVLLGYAVQGPVKESSVAQIMDLEAGTQHFLMLEVDQALKRIAAAKELPPPSPMDSPFTPAQRSGKRSSNRASNRRLLLDNEELQRQIEDHNTELARVRQEAREALRRRELELEEAAQEAQTALTAGLEAKTAQVTQLQAALDELREKTGDVGDLRDQLEVLKSQARDVSKKDATIAKLREKVNASSDLAQRVADLEASNEALLTKNLEAEQKAQDVAKLRQDLLTYKNALVDAQIKTNETNVLLEEKMQEVDALRSERDALRRNETATLEENRSLQSSLAGVRDEDDDEPAQVLGISELNPKVREELETLRKETARLRHELSAHSEENLAKLRLDADSLGGVNDRLQRDLREAVKRGDQWQAEAGRLDVELTAARERAHEAATRHEAELAYLVETSEKEKLAALLAEETASAARIEQLVDQRLEVEANLLKTRGLLEEYMANHSASNEQLEALRIELEREQEAHGQARDEATEREHVLEKSNASLEARIAALESQIVHGRARLNQEHENLMASEKQCEKYRLKAGELSYQVNQLRRQLKSVQVQRSHASGGDASGGAVGSEDLIADMQRLAAQNEQLLADNAQLRERAQTSGGSGGALRPSKGVSEMVRNYESEIQDLRKQMNMLTMAKTSEVMARTEAENRMQKLEQSNEDLNAENTSLRLKLERSAKYAQHQQPQQQQQQQQIKPQPLRERDLNNTSGNTNSSRSNKPEESSNSASGITGALPASRSAKAEFHARQAQYDASLKRGDEEFEVLLEHLDDRKDRIESTRHTKIRHVADVSPQSKYGEHETDMYEDIGTKGRGTKFGVARSLETSRSRRRIPSSASSASISSSSVPQNETAYWQRRAQEAEKTARFLEAQLERVEAELEAERALRSKEKHRLRELHQAEVDELQRLHASEVEQMQRLGGGFRESLEQGGASHCALLREDGGLSQRSGGGANTSVESRQDGDAYDSEPDAAADLNSSAFFEYLSGFEASAARLIADEEEEVLSEF
ncbi:Protein hook [Hondaea fermentalgiana]|uniref:Protein hook n=1 Tax=Hondaea fermentalgiana TaxID=2315210 RepID=A0A2R5G6P8_9STRA|nr:Protein hook [Hondaea fermentalgiana]|eukprot:GBG25468.1 Protein hook [Hondaea fermentalgiana]